MRRQVVAVLPPTAMFVAAALLLTARRLAGALVEPPSLPLAAACAIVLLAAIRTPALVWRLSIGDCYGVYMPGLWSLMFSLARPACWAAALIWAIALSLPGITPAAATVLWAPVVLSPLPWIVRLGRSLWNADRTPFAQPSPESGSAPFLDRTSPGASLVSHMTRQLLENGSEVVEGVVAVDFAAGTRWGAAHLAFCPPLAGPPAVEVSADERMEVEIKVVQALAYAARFDVRLAEPAEERLTVRLRYRLFAPVGGDSPLKP